MQLGKVILDVGSVAGLLTLFYSISQIIRKRPRFKFKFHGSSRNIFEKDGKDFCKLYKSGILRNQSLEPTSLNVIHTVVWSNRKTHSTLRHATGVDEIIDDVDGKTLKLPIMFQGHEAKKLKIISEFQINGTCDENILNQYEDVGGGIKLPKYEYKLLFEDENENVFDENGKLCNMEESGLRQTISNTMHELKDGKIRAFLKHYLKIVKSRIKFRLKIFLLCLGIWR